MTVHEKTSFATLACVGLALAIAYAAGSCNGEPNVKRCAPLEKAASKFVRGKLERAIAPKREPNAPQRPKRGPFGLGLLPQLEPDREKGSESTQTRVLLAFTYKTPGVCSACDQARPVVKRLAEEYPIEFVYWESAEAREQTRARGIYALPTFVLVERDSTGAARELQRWSGAYDCERRIRAAFDESGRR